MLRAIALALGLVAFAAACSKPSPVGGSCNTMNDCLDHNECLKDPSGKGVCTKSCMPSEPNDCPAPTKCQSISMSVDVPGKTVNIPKINRCLP